MLQAIDHHDMIGTYGDYQKCHVPTFFTQGLGQNQANQVPVEQGHLAPPELNFWGKVL